MSKNEDDITNLFKKSVRGQTKQSTKNLFEDINFSSDTHVHPSNRDEHSYRQDTIQYHSEDSLLPPTTNKTILATVDNQSELETVKDFMDNPVTGWVVIIDGPGQGLSLPLGFGSNTIGRSSNQRIQLNFGDTLISRENHAVITYEPRNSSFYLHHGTGLNLTYIENEDSLQPVLSPIQLENEQCIQMGNTKLKFIMLCNKNFKWGTIKTK